MAATHLHQIFFSEQTRRQLDPDFIPLDNSANARPDWREYWPIRNFLLNNSLVESDYYAFFSPAFGARTRLTAAHVNAFILEPGPQPDVVLFSPMWDMSAFFLNVFDQCETCHPEMTGVASELFGRIGAEIPLGDLITDSRDTVFCNYFAAKPAFWSAWLKIGEDLFSLAESGQDDFARKLNSPVPDYGGAVQQKVFIMERIATFLLATDKRWRARAFNPFQLSSSPTALGKFHFEAVVADALKIAFSIQPFPEYRDAFLDLRKRMVAQLQTKVY